MGGRCCADQPEGAPPAPSARKAEAAEAPGSPAAPGRGALRLVIWDFDCTLSAVHVFKRLAGWEGEVPLPHARTERGQLRRVAEDDLSAAEWAYDQRQREVVRAAIGAPAQPWVLAALGGPGRLQRLSKGLRELRGRGVEHVVLTKGYVGTAKHCLATAGVLHLFSAFCGQTGNSYGEPLDYDRVAASTAPSELEGAESEQLRTSKAKVIAQLLKARGLDPREAAFVDDDDKEVSAAQSLCHTIRSPPDGVGQQELERLQQLTARRA
eukprot:TRINITY_DN15940_c0_g3_i2.p2 TRINITY_DN15940_c0_g3~~TRINITY_DN15940_c0_g3_i2.p2  ORF type:complete len:294 (+),score=83.34 TRINITY_DN15940_c0_g3_i2:82-882(+)